MPLILGPFTWARPFAAALGGVLALRAADGRLVSVGVVLAILGVLAVEPLCDRLFHTRAQVVPVGPNTCL
jgi:hypothetical protein